MRFSLASLLLAITVAGVASLYLKYLLDSRPPEWTDFSTKELSRHQQDRRVVLLVFTADWDITSALTKRTLERPRVSRWLRRHDAIVMRADASKPASPVHGKLAELTGRKVLPVVAIYAPGKSEAIVLTHALSDTEILTILEESIQ